jgi:hypothetical protein
MTSLQSDAIDKVNVMWRNPLPGRKIARDVLPIVTGFSVEMIESWGLIIF